MEAETRPIGMKFLYKADVLEKKEKSALGRSTAPEFSPPAMKREPCRVFKRLMTVGVGNIAVGLHHRHRRSPLLT
ncbi:unnamed protein product [Victoria cruziana]